MEATAKTYRRLEGKSPDIHKLPQSCNKPKPAYVPLPGTAIPWTEILTFFHRHEKSPFIPIMN
jgi:hypothetical protein